MGVLILIFCRKAFTLLERMLFLGSESHLCYHKHYFSAAYEY